VVEISIKLDNLNKLMLYSIGIQQISHLKMKKKQNVTDISTKLDNLKQVNVLSNLYTLGIQLEILEQRQKIKMYEVDIQRV